MAIRHCRRAPGTHPHSGLPAEGSCEASGHSPKTSKSSPFKSAELTRSSSCGSKTMGSRMLAEARDDDQYAGGSRKPRGQSEGAGENVSRSARIGFAVQLSCGGILLTTRPKSNRGCGRWIPCFCGRSPHELGVELQKRSAIICEALQSPHHSALSGRKGNTEANPRRGLTRAAYMQPIKQSNNYGDPLMAPVRFYSRQWFKTPGKGNGRGQADDVCAGVLSAVSRLLKKLQKVPRCLSTEGRLCQPKSRQGKLWSASARHRLLRLCRFRWQDRGGRGS